MTSYQESPNAATSAQRLGGRKVGPNDWRIPHLCGGSAPGAPVGDNPGLSIRDGDSGLLIVCHYGCNAAEAYKAVTAALGIDQNTRRPRRAGPPEFETGRCPCPNCGTEALSVGEIPGTGWPRLACDCKTTYDRLLSAVGPERWTAWAEYWLADGGPRRQVRSFPSRPGKAKSTWEQEPAGAGGKRPRRSARGLTPLVWGDDAAGNALVICEGEKAAAALVSAGINSAGYTPVSTQAAAGMRNANYAALVSGRNVIVWPDADDVNPTTGRREGPAAAAFAVPRILDSGATSVRLVDPGKAAALVPVGGKTDGADAADVPPDLIPGLLATATEYTPETDTAGGAAGRRYAWYGSGEFLPPWDCTPDADIARTMRMHAGDLLAVIGGKHITLMVADEGGVWTNRLYRLNQRIADTALVWLGDAARDDSVGRELMGQVARWQKRTAAQAGRNAALDSVGRVLPRWWDDNSLPPALTQCQDKELDADTRYLGAPNGVIDLHTGECLTGAAARLCMVSRSLPDPYDPDATHEAVTKLLAHLGDDEREWLLSALGHALRGRPNRRDYLIVGEGGGGKSTLLTAIADALDEHAGFIAIGAIANRKYANGPEPELEAFTNRRLMFYSEPPANLDYKRGKNQSGGDVVAFRRLFEGETIEKRTTATRFFACNPDDVPTLPLDKEAVFDRVRTLPYPALPESERDLTLPDRLNTKAARQAMAALLVRYAVANPAPPADIPSVAAMREELRAAGVGEAGTWLQNALVKAPEQMGLSTVELWESARAASGNTTDGLAFGYTRRQFIPFARQLLNLPPPRIHRMGPDMKAQNGWRGWRLATDEEQQAHFERMLSPTCAMPGCDIEAVSGSRFCAECDNLLDGPREQAQPQYQTGPVEIAAETLSEHQSEALEVLTRRPDLSRSVSELLERVKQEVLSQMSEVSPVDLPMPDVWDVWDVWESLSSINIPKGMKDFQEVVVNFRDGELDVLLEATKDKLEPEPDDAPETERNDA